MRGIFNMEEMSIYELVHHLQKLDEKCKFQLGTHATGSNAVEQIKKEGLCIVEPYTSLDAHIKRLGKIDGSDDEMLEGYNGRDMSASRKRYRTRQITENLAGGGIWDYGTGPLVLFAFPNQIEYTNCGDPYLVNNTNYCNYGPNSEADELIIQSKRFQIEGKEGLEIQNFYYQQTDEKRQYGHSTTRVPAEFILGVYTRKIRQEQGVSYEEDEELKKIGLQTVGGISKEVKGEWHQNPNCLILQPKEIFDEKMSKYMKILQDTKNPKSNNTEPELGK